MRNAGGKTEREEQSNETEHPQELDLKGEREVIESTTDLESPLEQDEDSYLDESYIEEVESTAPLLSDEEAGRDIQDLMKEIDYAEEKLTRGHKLRLMLTKGSVVVASCSVLVVGVVLAAVLHYDYSICEIEDTSLQLLTTTLHSTSSSICLVCRTTLLPSPTPATLQLIT